jgi:osmotically inducible protein OsmC
MIKKHGSAVWQGGLKDGNGTFSMQSGVVSDKPYSFATRFEGKEGSNPEEMIGAAHASCYAMALSAQLGERGITADRIEARSTITLDPGQGAVTAAHLDVTITASGADEVKAMEAANAAKEGCPISKLLNAEITMDAKLG